MTAEPPLSPALLDLPFDQYGRHRLVARVAERLRAAQGGRRLAVLDVGGYPCLTPRFLPEDDVVVVDVAQGAAEGARYVRADGAALPFPDRSFDLVVSLDSLEHVRADRRAAYVSELLRASRRCVVLVAPFASQETELAEQLLAAFVRVVNQEEQPQLREHREFGLPVLEEWEAFVQERGFRSVRVSSGFLYNWLPMMLLKHYVMSLPGADALHLALDHFYNAVLQASDAREPGYRRGLVIACDGSEPLLRDLAAALRPLEGPDRLEVVEQLERIGLLLKLADLHVASRRDDRLRHDLIDKERHIANLEALLAHARAAAEAAQAESERLRAELAAARGGRLRRLIAAAARVVSRPR